MAGHQRHIEDGVLRVDVESKGDNPMPLGNSPLSPKSLKSLKSLKSDFLKKTKTIPNPSKDAVLC